ncbi:MAG: extracellular solute-binding protein [Rhodothermales bacterium]|nr:extracellular solute-binding protein [Rhodothermales bacterium]MBO6778275.1 extracellular solute-binding protein [Rhodothermales bacterium]
MRASLLLLLFLVGCAGDSRDLLVVYSPHGKEMLGEYELAFEARYPSVDVRWIDMGGQDAYDRIRTEAANPQASIWWGGDSPTFSKAAAEGLLEPYRPSWADAVPEGSRDAEDRWYATYLTPEVIMYNSRTVEEGERPVDWDDLLEPEWNDRIIIRYPLASSTMRTIWGALIMRQPTVQDGYNWLARLDVNTKTYTADPTQLYLKLAREEGDVSLWNLPDTQIQSSLNGYPFGFAVPSSGTPILNDGIALVRGGSNPDMARAFYEFVTSDSALVQQAETYFRIPVRQDIGAERLPEWMASPIVPMDVDWGRLEIEGALWMEHWDQRIKGRGAEYLEELGG